MSAPTPVVEPEESEQTPVRPRRAVIAGACLGVVAVAAATVAVVLGVGHSDATAGHALGQVPPPPSASQSSQAVTTAPVQPVQPVQPTHPVTPDRPVPSAAVATLQRELGQLNYYEGPVTGLMNPQTTAAITYLQRDAHLPRTGVMNAATERALAGFLAHGNSQMGS